MATMLLLPIVLLVTLLVHNVPHMTVTAESANTTFQVTCGGILTMGRVDPIISPGLGGTSNHVHVVYGSNAFSSNVTYEQLTQSSCSTCAVLEDNSVYWFPTLYYHNASANTYTSVRQMAPGAALYYLFRGPEQARAFPAGFRMIAGDMTRRTPYNDIDPSFVPYVSYVCMDFDGVSQYITAFPNKTCPSGLRAQLNFPACWDGVNLDSPTHNTHVAYSTGDNFDQNACPSTHPVRLPEIFAEVSWQVADFPYTAGPWPFVWSFNDTTGYGYHGDFVNGWDVAAFQAALDQNCTSLDDCDAFHIRDSTEAATCTLQNLTANLPYVSERVLGTLPNLIIGTGSPVVAVNAYNAINSAAQNGHCSTFPQINYAGTPVLNTSTYHSSLPAGAIMLTTAATTPSCYESYEGWQSDAAYVSGGAFAGLATSTTVVQSPLGAVLTDDEVRQAVYTSNRWGLFSYNIPVAVAGQYNIRLVFAESYWSTIGSRVFNVTAQGRTIIANLDLSAIGPNPTISSSIAAPNGGLQQVSAYVYQGSVTVESTSLAVALSFIPIRDNALVSAVEVWKAA